MKIFIIKFILQNLPPLNLMLLLKQNFQLHTHE